MSCVSVQIRQGISCISAYVRRVTDACLLKVTKPSGITLRAISASPGTVHIGYEDNIRVNVLSSSGTKVNVGIVCTVSTSDGNEMWWCRSWRVLWNNGVKALWKN